MMKKKHLGFVIVLIVGFVFLAGVALGKQNQKTPPDRSESNIQQGAYIAPVPLDLKGKNRAMVRVGSYYVNAVAGCNDCHTCQSYGAGDNPYTNGPPGKINADNYLAGGVPFGPFTSANITPENGMPAGLTLSEFIHVIRTGQDPDNPSLLLQVMPWPIYRNMTYHDLKAVYEYLSSIPHAQPGDCSGAGQ